MQHILLRTMQHAKQHAMQHIVRRIMLHTMQHAMHRTPRVPLHAIDGLHSLIALPLI